MAKKIKVEVLKKVFDKIIEKMTFEEVTEVEIPYDLYCIIPTDKWEISQDNRQVETGSLIDDLEYVEKLADDPDRICTYVDFDRVASLLRIISQVQNPY